MKKLRGFFGIAVAFVIYAIGGIAFGQIPSAAIRGSIADSSNAVIAGALLNIQQNQTGVRRIVETKHDGSSQIEGLDPGDYQIEISIQGFAPEVYSLTLHAGDYLTVDFELKPGKLTEAVTVHGEISGINASGFTIGGNVGRFQIENLPLNGRNFVRQYYDNVESRSRRVTNPDNTVTVIRPRTPFNQVISPITLPEHFFNGDSFLTQDVRLTRRLNIGETIRLSLIGEVFNVFNIANLSGYSNVLNQVNYGQPSTRAGQVFGSGGPRAFQFATRLLF